MKIIRGVGSQIVGVITFPRYFVYYTSPSTKRLKEQFLISLSPHPRRCSLFTLNKKGKFPSVFFFQFMFIKQKLLMDGTGNG